MAEENAANSENSNGAGHAKGAGDTEATAPGSSVSSETNNNEGSQASSEQVLRSEIESLKKDYLYLKAEFDTYKRNAMKERSDLIKYGGERLAVDLLEVLDTFERALSGTVTPENFRDFQKGIEMTATSLKSLLQRFGIEEIDSLKKPFDPKIHEALSSEETSEVEEGHVCRVFKKPYKFHEKLIRPGQVVVATKPKH